MRKLQLFAIALAVFFPIAALAGSGGYSDKMSKSNKDIVDTAAKAGSFNTLVQAIQAAELEEVLRGEGPFTVFAPTDEAFGKLPAGTLEDLLKPENKSQLQAILTYHVVPGNMYSQDVVKMQSGKTVNGQEMSIRAETGSVWVDEARVTQTDIPASNGVIHVIDSVLMPR